MTLPRRLINIAGTLAVVVALVAGTLLIALPVYLESIEIRNERTQVAAANRLLVTEVEGLLAKEAEMPQLEAELRDLREELSHIPQLDDVAQVSLRAADKTDARIESISFGDPAAFVPRNTEDIVASLPRTATDVVAEATAGDEATEAADPANSDEEADAPGAASGSRSDNGHLQVPITVTVTARDAAAASRFLDELRAGARLIQIDTVTGVVNTDTDEVTLTVTGLVFVRLN